jgi:hypothetical protein
LATSLGGRLRLNFLKLKIPSPKNKSPRTTIRGRSAGRLERLGEVDSVLSWLSEDFESLSATNRPKAIKEISTHSLESRDASIDALAAGGWNKKAKEDSTELPDRKPPKLGSLGNSKP